MASNVEKPYYNTPVKFRPDSTMGEVGGEEQEEEGEDQLDSLFKYWSNRPNVTAPKAVTFSLAQLDRDNNCHRCGKKVYPVEKVDIGVLYHKGCFKCRVCSRQLTLQTFQRELDIDSSRIKEVYCNSHVPRQAAGYGTDALGIRSALDAQKRASKKIQHRVYPDHHYVPDYTHRGSGDWSPGASDTEDPPPPEEFNEEEPEIPSLGENKFLQEDKNRVSYLNEEPQDASEYTPRTETEIAAEVPVEPEVEEVVEDEGGQIEMVETPAEVTEEEEEEKSSLLRRRESVKERNSTIRRRSTLRSFQDFEKFGVFDAQSMLERAQREEEDQLYSQIEAERRTLRQRLDESLRAQRDHSMQELKAFFEQNNVPQDECQAALIKVEEYYRRRREAALRSLLQRLAAEEQAAVARMVEKHSNEMIQLIQKKDRLASQSSMSRDNKQKPLVVTAVLKPTTTTTSTGHTQHQHLVSESAARMSPLSAGSVHQADDSSVSAFTPIKTGKFEPIRTPVNFTPIPANTEDEKEDDVADLESLSLSESWRMSRHRQFEYERDDDDEGEEEDKMAAPTVNDSSESLEFPAIPEAEPPECPKNKLFTDPEVFKEQDRRAIEESKKEHKTFTDLVRQLSRRCQTELQKVRSIFRWVTVKDLNRMKFDERLDPNSPLGLLRGIKMGTESYHDLFKRLCSYAGLHCEVIEGYSKGAGYRPGAPIAGDTFRNQWTAVWVDGSWRFINCKWGARHVKATRDTNLTYKCDEFYFLTDPEDHIYQHFPDDEEWQLLKDPIHLYEFIRLPVIKSPFFNHRLSLAHTYNANLQATEGQVELRLTSPQLVAIAAKLKSTNREIPSEILLDRSLVRHAGPEAIISINLPSPGTYFLDLYVGEWESDRMDSACAFQITCSDISRDANVTYPQVGCFGRTPGFGECGMSEDSHTDPYIVTDGTLNVRFNLTKNVSLRPSLRRWDPRDRSMTDYDRYVLYRERSTHVAAFDLQLPRRGLFVFSIYVTNPDDPASPMISIYKYLIDCKSPNLEAFPFPKASKRFKHCRVVEPLCGDLSPETEVTFKLESRRAVGMMVVFNNKSYQLKQEGRVWHGRVYLNIPTGKVMVYARFESSGDKYIPLLEYHISTRRKTYSFVS